MNIHQMPAQASLPPGRRVYAIGDVHGCLDRLQAMHATIAQDLAADPIASPLLVHLGDYIDRGPDSAGVVRYLRAGFPGVPAVNLMGNHERMMLEALNSIDPETFEHWLGNGGDATLQSWGVPVPYRPHGLHRLIPAEDQRFLYALQLHHREGGYLFVHAGIRPGLPLERQSPHDLLWMREPFLSWTGDLGAIVVHGHTPIETPVVRPNRIGIDTGAVRGGALTCAVLQSDRLGFLFA